MVSARRAPARVCPVDTAHHTAVDTAPVTSPNRRRSASAATLSSSSRTRAPNRPSSTSAVATSPSANATNDTPATWSTPACTPASPDTNGRVGVCHNVIESHLQHGSEHVTGYSSRHPTVSTQHACERRTTHPGWSGPSPSASTC